MSRRTPLSTLVLALPLLAACDPATKEGGGDAKPADKADGGEAPDAAKGSADGAAGDKGNGKGEAGGDAVPPEDPSAATKQDCAMLQALAGEWKVHSTVMGARKAETLAAGGTYSVNIETADCKAKATVTRHSSGLAFKKPKQYREDTSPPVTADLQVISDTDGKGVLAAGEFTLSKSVTNRMAFVADGDVLHGYWTRAGRVPTLLGTLHGKKGSVAPSTYDMAHQPCTVKCLISCEDLALSEDSLQQAEPEACVNACREDKPYACGDEKRIPDTHKLALEGPFKDHDAVCEHVQEVYAKAHKPEGSTACDEPASYRLFEEDRQTESPAVSGKGSAWTKGTIYGVYDQSGFANEVYYAAIQTKDGWYVSDEFEHQAYEKEAEGDAREVEFLQSWPAPLAKTPGDEFYLAWDVEVGPSEVDKRPRDEYALACAVEEGKPPACIRIHTAIRGKNQHVTFAPNGVVILRKQAGTLSGPDALKPGRYRWID